MKTFFAAILLLMTTHCVITQKSHQPTLENTDHSKMQKQIYSSMRELDSMNARINDGNKQTMHPIDSINNHLQQE